MLDNIPHEMRSYNQWLVWRYEDLDAPKPTKIPYSARTHRHASVTNAETWSSYEEAVAALESGQYSGIGFVLSDADPYAFIDLDDTKGDQTAFDRQMAVYKEFDSYAELSPSGKGLHIIVKGAIESGRRRSSIEIYSNQRYMTMTGNIYRDAPIRDHNELLQVLYTQMGGGNAAVVHYAGLAQATESDAQVIERATSASNGEKFLALYNGEWEGLYGSQSEADFALIDIIAFYTQNRAQIVQIFRNSELGKRDKAKRNDYVSYMLNKCFDRMLPPVDIDGLRNLLNEAIERKTPKQPKDDSEPAPPLKAPPVDLQPAKSIYTPPPGLIGQIAQFIYAQAPRPVPEIALAGALGLVAGIVGRSYNVSGTGLNQYVLLLAPTGTGKEAIARGIDKLMNAVVRSVPSAMEFIGPAEISSQQALSKYMSKTAVSFVSVVGEFGIQLKLMASPHAPPHLVGLMRMILDLYNKSGQGNMMRPTIYSDREKNTNTIQSPAFTWLGESTPEKFYEALDETMITSGLLPRFTTIEYNGDRPPLNPAHIHALPSFEVIEKLATLCAHSLMLNSQHKAINVETTPEAKRLFDQFDRHCDDQINNSEREVRRHLWNRAHIKALKLAALVAVGMNPYEPTIDVDVATWALNLIVADVRTLLNKFDAGEIGVDNDETKQLTTVIKCIRDYITLPWSEVEKYVAGQGRLHGERIIPYAYIQRRLAAAAVFRKDKRGSSDALKRTLKTLVERGDLTEVSKATLSKTYETTAVCYMIAVPRVFDLA